MNPQHSIEVRRVTLSKAQVSSLSSDERNFLVFSGHALNELNSLNKVFAWCLGSSSLGLSHGLVSLANGMQSMMYGRVLAGKLLETWGGFEAGLFACQLSRQLEPQLPAIAASALTDLKRYFGRKNLIRDVRNGYSFHYAPKELGRRLASDPEPLEFVFGGTIGNNLNVGCEFEANASVFLGVSTSSLEAGMRAFLEEVQSIHGLMNTALEGCLLLLIEKAINGPIADESASEQLAVHDRFADVRIPWFCAP